MADLVLFSPSADGALAESIARQLRLSIGPLEQSDFPDGEHHARPLEAVRGKDVFVIESLHAEAERSIDDKLLRLLFLIGTLVDAAAARVTAVLPYLCYARKDQQNRPRDPVVTRHLARLFEAVGVCRVVTLDVHNLAAFQNAWRCRTEHLEAAPLFVRYFAERLGTDPVVVVSPDSGGVRRAERFRQLLVPALEREVRLAFMEKHRGEKELTGAAMVGEVAGRTAIIFDDLISTGATLLRAAQACRAQGAHTVFGAATHGVFAPGFEAAVANPALDRVVITNSIPPVRPGIEIVSPKIAVLAAAPLFAVAITALHREWHPGHD